MNNIERAILAVKRLQSGDMSTRHINEQIFDTIISALEHQLTNGWIPVSSGRLPNEGEVVLATINPKYAGDYRVVLQTYTERLDYWTDGTVLAWKYKPEPYKEAL